MEEAARGKALVEAEQWSRQAAAERMEAARRAEALRTAEQAARREIPESAASNVSARALRPELRPVAVMAEEQQRALEDMRPTRTPLRRNPRTQLPEGHDGSTDGNANPQLDLSQTTSPADAVDLQLASGLNAGQATSAVEAYARAQPYVHPSRNNLSLRADGDTPGSLPISNGHFEDLAQGPAPSWIGSQSSRPAELRGQSPLKETLQHSREKVAARWYALRGVFQGATAEAEAPENHMLEEEAPILAIYSVAGGVGKTSLAASLTRALAAQGERVLLVDGTDRGVLPFYFGARDLRPGVLRTFAPPAGSTDQPISLVSYAAAAHTSDDSAKVTLAEQIKRDRKGFSRVLVDLGAAAAAPLQDLVAAGANVLIPLAPDMNSVLSLAAVKRSLQATPGAQPGAVQGVYVLVQFEPSQALQLDVRELLQQQLREDLLPYTVRRSPLIGEALAEGMTVIDYAPGEGISKDYVQIAAWVRTLAEPAREGLAQARWSER